MGLNDGEKVILRGPGEYEVGGVEVLGVGAGSGDTVYVINVDGVTIGILGEISEVLTDKKIERINAVDVLMASVGGEKVVGGKIVLSWAKKWGANYLIPVGGQADTGEMKKFMDEVDREDLQPVESLKVDSESLPEGLEIVWIH
ncbi:MAG: MBL fold metallo-hydrolase [Candidatus Shapirobacteria bacterium]